MKGFIIYEDFITNVKSVVNCGRLSPSCYTCRLGTNDLPEASVSGGLLETTTAICKGNDKYDFEVGALIALMKMCGREKALKAVEELYLLKEPRGADLDGDVLESKAEYVAKENKRLIEENETLKKEIKCLKIKNKYFIEDINRKFEYITEFKRSNDVLKEENEKLKLDCEKLQHGYNDMVFCGGRQNGKQHTALVNMFKKIDQKKVDAAYKEAYDTTLPVWQKEVLNQMYGVYKESKEKSELPRTLDINGTTYLKSFPLIKHNDQLDSLIEGSRAFTRKCVDEWLYKLPTKREEMWEKILGVTKGSSVEIKVVKLDITTFLRELQDKMPEVRWNGSDCLPVDLSVPDWFKHDYIYFFLFRNYDKGNLRLCYGVNPHSCPSWARIKVDYLPPMHWGSFKKGRLAVKVTYENYKEFYEACEKELGKKPAAMYCGDFTVSICKKDGNFEIFTMEDQKKTGRKIVNWEDVR